MGEPGIGEEFWQEASLSGGGIAVVVGEASRSWGIDVVDVDGAGMAFGAVQDVHQEEKEILFRRGLFDVGRHGQGDIG